MGPIAGWPPHQSVDESRDVIKNVLSGKEAYAICLKEDGKAIGAIELKLNGHTDMTDRDDECEMGYWLGKPFWGQGIMPEAVKEMLRHAFEDCGDLEWIALEGEKGQVSLCEYAFSGCTGIRQVTWRGRRGLFMNTGIFYGKPHLK